VTVLIKPLNCKKQHGIELQILCAFFYCLFFTVNLLKSENFVPVLSEFQAYRI